MSAAWIVPPDVVEAVVTHMNADHAQDCVTLCRRHAGDPSIEVARLVHLDADALVFEVSGAGDDHPGQSPVRIPWLRPLRERADLRIQLTEMVAGPAGSPHHDAPPRDPAHEAP